MDFGLKFGGEDQKKKKRSSSQNLRLLHYVHLICLAVSEKKRLWLAVFGQKFASCASTKVYSRLRSSTGDLGGHGSKCHPPCISVARIFDCGGGEGGGQTKNHMQRSHQKFSKEEFLLDKDIVEWKIRSGGLVWHLTLSIPMSNNQGRYPISVSNAAIGWSEQLFYKIE